ncbi:MULTISPECIES: hypothetical protein [Xanthomonas]|uniref:hypothetical protein n=1 Tax=Xanthomonas TaxID=338 RepID=UPI001C493936|nr:MULTISPECIES: hypothetical protein [Xanthomonas]MBV6867923.1 hypothetical protein [Xanthomonas campestris pv. coriandri]MCE4330842.1 hypothetical protein [Xanthomonas campestris pv. coriandri]MEA9776959.1 hypothetical protein [Xanthomonas campestris pv. raphani]
MNFVVIRSKAKVAADFATLVLCLPASVAACLLLIDGQFSQGIGLSLAIIGFTSVSVWRLLRRNDKK